MPVRVSMVDVLGNRQGEFIDDTSDLFHTNKIPLDDPAYPYLGAMDIYEDTVFNPLQIRRFLEEWRRWGKCAQTEEQKEYVRRVEELAEKCMRESMYLKFYGN